MNLPLKTFIALTLAFGLVFGGLYLAVQQVVLPSYAAADEAEARRNADRAKSALASHLEQLSLKTSDLSYWDETYEWAAGRNPKYFETNVGNGEALFASKIDYLVFFDKSGKLLGQRGVDFAKETVVPVPDHLTGLFKTGTPLMDHKTPDGVIGVVATPDGPMMVSAKPIAGTTPNRPFLGTVAHIKKLDDTTVKDISNLVHMPLAFYPFDGAMPTDVTAVKSGLAADKPVSRELDGSKVASYVALNDVFGKPALIVRVEQPRVLFEQGAKSANLFLLMAGALGLLTLALTELILFSSILRPIARLSAEANKLGDKIGKGASGISDFGQDEIGRLAKSINSMLGRLATSVELAKQNQALEQQVKERTKELDDRLKEVQNVNQTLVERELKIKQLKDQLGA